MFLESISHSQGFLVENEYILFHNAIKTSQFYRGNCINFYNLEFWPLCMDNLHYNW
jgi:hypothetical protein